MASDIKLRGAGNKKEIPADNGPTWRETGGCDLEKNFCYVQDNPQAWAMEIRLSG